MGKGKRIILAVAAVLLISGFWYLNIKDHDYRIKLTKTTAPGTIYQHISKWGNALEKEGELTVLKTTGQPFSHFEQTLKIGDSLIRMNWKLESMNDSVTEITIKILDLDHSLATRLKNLYTDPPLKNMFLSKATNFSQSLDFHLKKHKVKFVGDALIPEANYAYISTESSLSKKAAEMIDKNGIILPWLKEKNIKVLSEPTVKVTSWDIENDHISFDFMFPINKPDSLPFHPDIKFQKYGGNKGIKAIFNGNYTISDRAWFTLKAYAERNNIDVEYTPVEFFFNNPMEGGSELNWKAEVYLPIKE
ncbi:hypothetical protein [Spongiimicrobium sp. 3-5]|uniref:hypothetical protein n=1 Tax=Spongiimicrobium sp. 3-5 TaxID=3332596 RepID=UPI00398129D1